MHDIATFLRRFPPFDGAAVEAVDRAAAAATIEFFAAGSFLLHQGGAPEAFVRVVRTGAVELLDGGRVIDVLGEGELLGHASMLAHAPADLGARAAEDTLAYAIPADAMEPLLAELSGLRYVVRSLGRRSARRAGSDPASRAMAADPADRPVGALARPAPIVEPATAVRDAAAAMVELGASCVLVALPGGGLGIVTDRDLRTRIVAADAPATTPVADVMTAPARTVAADRATTAVLFDMLQYGLRHLPVVDPAGAVLGVVADGDLVAIERRAPFRVRGAIARAGDVDAIAALTAEVPQILLDLHAVGVPPLVVSETLAALVDATTRRLLELAEAELGRPPVRYTWYQLGSLGRREGGPGSDIDNALAWVGPGDDPALRATFAALAERVCAGLVRCGFHVDTHQAVASHPLFARGIDAWEAAVDGWLAEPTQGKVGIVLSLLCDARPIWGASATDGRLAAAVARLRGSPEAMRLLARLAIARHPPTGFIRDLVVEADGEHQGRLDIKHGGLLPIGDLARLYALRAGVVGGSTRARLAAARDAGVLGADDATMLAEAFDVCLELRLDHQARQLARGEAPDEFIDPRQLGRLGRTGLREAFRAVGAVQRRIQAELATGIV